MQRPGLAPRAFSLLAEWLPIPLQCFPHWFPILGGRFHDYFFSLLLEKPCGQASQLFGAAAKLAPLKRVFTFDFDVTDDYRQHLFVNVDSRYPIRHSSSRPGAESVLRFLNQGRGLSLFSPGDTTPPNYPLKYARSGSDSSADSTSPGSSRPRHPRPVQC